MQDIFFSVIIPVYNRNKLLKRAIDSVLNQTYSNFEIIIIDDNSQEDIGQTIKFYKSNKIRYIKSMSNKGVSVSRNIGIKESKFEYIAFLDSDDEWIDIKLEIQKKYILKNPQLKLIHTNETWILNGSKINQKLRHLKSGGDIFLRSLELCLISPSSVVIHKDLFDTYGLFDEQLKVCEDYDMWLRITAFENIGFIDMPLIIKYGGHSDQLSRSFEAMDKYRVFALVKMFNNSKLESSKKSAVKNTALFKINILLNGAIKRNKKEDIDKYRELIECFK